jgi:hypothetical protein
MSRYEDPGDPDLMSGEAWAAFCDELKAAGQAVLRDDMPSSPRDRAEGFRYLTRLLRASALTRLEGMDADCPRLVTCCTDTQKYGLENPDCWYQQAKLRGDATYRIWGKRGDVRFLGFQVTGGIFSNSNPYKTGATLNANDMKIEADGSFELILSPVPHEGNWLELNEGSKAVLVRQFFYDWDQEKERPAELNIERIDTAFEHKPITSAQVSRRLKAVASWVGETANFWCDHVLNDKRKDGVNCLTPPSSPGGDTDGSTTAGTGAAENAYGHGTLVLEPDEAFYFEVTPPKCHYWNFQLGSVWWESLDYANRQTNLNGHSAYVGPDGVFRCVVAHEDPGVWNWLDTTGLTELLVLYRFQLAESAPAPTYKLVKIDEVASCFPADTPRVTREERDAETVKRRALVARRFR